MFISTDVTFFESQPYYLKPSPPLPLPIMLDDIQSPPMVLRFTDPPITYQRKPKPIIPDSRPPPSNKFADPPIVYQRKLRPTSPAAMNHHQADTSSVLSPSAFHDKLMAIANPTTYIRGGGWPWRRKWLHYRGMKHRR